MAVTSGVIAAIAAAGTLAKQGYDMANPPKSPKMPSPIMPDMAQLSRKLLPGATANSAAQTGGGMSPEFMANTLGQQTGDPSGGLTILEDIRKSLGGGQAL